MKKRTRRISRGGSDAAVSEFQFHAHIPGSGLREWVAGNEEDGDDGRQSGNADVDEAHEEKCMVGLGAAESDVESGVVEGVAGKGQSQRHFKFNHPPEDRAEQALPAVAAFQFIEVTDVSPQSRSPTLPKGEA